MAADFTFDFAPHQIPPLLVAIKQSVGGLPVSARASLTNRDMQRSVLVIEFDSRKAILLPGCMDEARAVLTLTERARQIFDANHLGAEGHAEQALARLGIPRARP